MNRHNTDDDEFPDATYDESTSEADPDGMSLSGDDELGQARIEEYRDISNRQEDPRRAIVGPLVAGLSEIASQYEPALKNYMQSAGGNLLENAHAQRGIKTYVSLAHEVYCLLNLDERLGAAEQQAAKINAQRRMDGLPALGGLVSMTAY